MSSISRALRIQKKAKEFARGGDSKEDEKDESSENIELPLGAVLELQGFTENGDTKREDIKEKLVEDFEIEATSVAFVYYNKGETNAKLRFQNEGAAKKLAVVMKEKLGDKQWFVKDTEIQYKVLEGDEITRYQKKMNQIIKQILKNNLFVTSKNETTNSPIHEFKNVF